MSKKCSNPACPLTQAVHVIGGKWKLIIISQLGTAPKRFGQFDAAIPGISRKVLTKQLNELLEDGLINRQAYAEMPPRVEYSLTPKSKELLPILLSMAKWGLYLVDNPDEELARKLRAL